MRTAPDQPSPSPDSDAFHLRTCPFCGGKAVLASDDGRSGVKCVGCGAMVPATSASGLPGAVATWNRRAGTTSAAGGRATRGVMTKRKRAACKRNLRRARRMRKQRRVIAEHVALLDVHRRVVTALRDVQREMLAAHEPRIRQDPLLLPIYELVMGERRRQAEGTKPRCLEGADGAIAQGEGIREAR